MTRVWIYQADRFLDDSETAHVNSLIADFVSSWTAHGSALEGKAYIKNNLFLIFEVDESHAGVTGCSVDKSVHFIKGLEQQLGISFFDRMKVSYIDAEGIVRLADRSEFEQLVKDGVVNSDTVVFNNLVQNIEELDSKWQVPFRASWHSKVF